MPGCPVFNHRLRDAWRDIVSSIGLHFPLNQHPTCLQTERVCLRVLLTPFEPNHVPPIILFTNHSRSFHVIRSTPSPSVETSFSGLTLALSVGGGEAASSSAGCSTHHSQSHSAERPHWLLEVMRLGADSLVIS